MNGLDLLGKVGTFICFSALFYGLMLYYQGRRAIRERLRGSAADGLPLLQRDGKQHTLMKQFLEWLSSFGKLTVKDQEEVSKSRAVLSHAGVRHPKGAAIFAGIRALTAIVLPLPYLMTMLMQGRLSTGVMVFGLLLAALGFYLPHYGLKYYIKRRQDRMDKALPDVLDLLIVCMEAGLSLQASINRLSDEIKPLSKDLYNELQLTNAELRTGIPRETAMKNLGERTGVQNIKSLVGLMIQSDKMGASIAQALRTHASFLRVQRAQKAEEKAAKLPVKILFPMLVFIFPAVFVVILGPAVIQILHSNILKN